MKNRLKNLGYKPATLKHDSNGWYIQYYVFSPVTNNFERIRTKLNCVRDNFRHLNDFRAYAEKMVQGLHSRTFEVFYKRTAAQSSRLCGSGKMGI